MNSNSSAFQSLSKWSIMTVKKQQFYIMSVFSQFGQQIHHKFLSSPGIQTRNNVQDSHYFTHTVIILQYLPLYDS